MIEETVVAGLAYFVFVFFKAFQQRNVAFNHYKWVIPISYLMSASEILVIALVARTAVQGWDHMIPMVLGVGTGGGLGACASMYLHNKIFKEDTNES